MHHFPIPVVALGPGSQPEDEALNYLPMPHDMRVFHAPVLPEPEALAGSRQARMLLQQVLEAVEGWRPGQAGVAIDLAALAPADLELIDQVLGEGEVSAQVELANAQSADEKLRIQESVFAGVWRVRGVDAAGRETANRIEVGDIPAPVRQAGQLAQATSRLDALPPAGPGVVNAPALLTEIVAHMAAATPAHVINLSLIPYTPEDGVYLDQALGRGRVAILSRGYGNCRITATGAPRVWWVQYFNAQDVLILNTIEIADVPEVARAAGEDLADSAERLAEVLEWIG